jgi:hypothetical protein
LISSNAKGEHDVYTDDVFELASQSG